MIRRTFVRWCTLPLRILKAVQKFRFKKNWYGARPPFWKPLKVMIPQRLDRFWWNLVAPYGDVHSTSQPDLLSIQKIKFWKFNMSDGRYLRSRKIAISSDVWLILTKFWPPDLHRCRWTFEIIFFVVKQPILYGKNVQLRSNSNRFKTSKIKIIAQ